MINITLGVALGSPNMKYPKNWFKIMNITQIPEMNPARGFCFIVHCGVHRLPFKQPLFKILNSIEYLEKLQGLFESQDKWGDR